MRCISEATVVSRWRDLNPRPLPYQGSALPLSYIGIAIVNLRAEDGAQTRDPQLGRLMLYQLSYFRKTKDFSKPQECGQRWIRTTEVERQQIYSLPHLATLVFAQLIFQRSISFSASFLEPLVGFEPTTPRLQITCSGQLS